MAESTKTVEFDPGIGQLATDLYLEVYIIENDMANIPQFARKARYFAATYRKILKALINNIGFYRGCLGWAYYTVNEHKGEAFTGNPFVNYTEEQKAQYAPTEMVDFCIEYLPRFESDLKYYHIKNVKLPENAMDILNQYREFLSINEGFINAKTVDDVKLPENIAFSKTTLEIKAELDKAIETKNLDNLINL